ncbi:MULTISPECIES: conjugal transfer protein [Streptomyces]|uniref:Conjugal transfer protein n=1 Tax=Streptomyces mirabilis TaxID=68239 RepID=A0ABU3V6H2_9ACTN|nr:MULTISPECIES: conjugal transfer protein [Streptomyces]MDU9001748.1 conjugal transfer protein [Streptomyces mirabilis]QDN74589.1 conjugal transfer protein [Streptomyces sp. S1A1-7]QDN93563.1 conjugal transfer protein [Streptomyces sp. RLB3-6]QDO05054.1 conjugal transfer protein [Streptomyces sp. S1D4-23]
MSPGKQASESDAAPPMAAGARLEKMRRRVRLSRLALFTAIAAGPVALGVAVMSGPPTVAAAPSDKPAAVHSAAAAADPAGYAQVFVDAWLHSSADDANSAQARLAQSLAPDVDLPDPVASAQPKPAAVTAVRSAQRGDGEWAVTVAAQYADGRLRYFVVPMTANASGALFAVTGAPGVVAGPARAEVPKSSYGVTVPEGDLSSAVGEFLAAYLTGAGEVDRYLAPGVRMSAVSPAPYTTVSVQQVSAVEEAAAGQVPADGTKVRVLAQVEARDSGGRWPLGYELTLTARSGRWEVAALESGTAQDGGAR